MKKLTLSLALIVCVLTAQAGLVTREEASQKAAAFLSSISFSPDGSRAFAPAQQHRKLRAVEVELPFYVFNVGEKNGFILVSSDDRTPSVLGYADSGSFDDDAMPENLRAWLRGYAAQLQWLAQQPSDVALRALRRAPAKVAVKNPVSPLVTTLWSQGNPYNQQCPVFVNGARCVTGCVATAMAQVMNFHQWPDSTVVDIPGHRVFSNYTSGGVQLDTLFAPLRFDWMNMQETYQGNEPQEQLDAVAHLMAAAGWSVRMDYHDDANGGSSAYALDIPRALRTYFDYSAMTHLEYRQDYLMDEWDDLIYSELAARRPVIYSGSTTTNGHSFIVDGYSSGNFFHVNWGWAGAGNGYFLLSILNPYDDENFRAGSGGSVAHEGYSFSQTAVVGIKKNEGEAPVERSPLLVDVSEINGDRLTCSFLNSRADQSDSYDVGVAYIRADGVYVPVQQTQIDLSYTPGRSVGQAIEFQVTGFPDGTYRLLPACKRTADVTWLSSWNPDRIYVRADVVEGETTLTLVGPQAELTAAIDLVGTHRLGDAHTVRVDVQNAGDEYDGSLYFFADTAAFTAPRGQAALVVAKDDRKQVTFNYTPIFDNIPADSSVAVRVSVATDKQGTAVIADTLFVFSGGEPKVIVRSDSLAIRMEAELTPLSADGMYLLGNDAKVKVRLTNTSDTTYVGNYGFVVHYVSPLFGTGYYHFSRYQNQYVLAGHSVDEAVVNLRDQAGQNLPMGQVIFLELIYTRQGAWQTASVSENQLIVAPVVKKYKADGSLLAERSIDSCFVEADITAVNLRQAFDTRSVTGGNPNTLYYIDASVETLPEGLGTNVVRGAEADSIVLRDGFDFMPPMDFTAKAISYTRTFQRGFHRDSIGGWNTLVLPFAVTSVEVAEAVALEDTTITVARPIDWYRSTTDTGKDFWIMQFDDEEGRTMWFEPINRFVANRPYLITVPEDTTAANLVGSPITFRGEKSRILSNASMEATGHSFVFHGNRAYQQREAAYVLDPTGEQFILCDTVVQAFRAYFSPVKSSFLKNLTIATDAQLDAVPSLRYDMALPDDEVWYGLDGRRIAAPTRPGLYLHRGRKVVVR